MFGLRLGVRWFLCLGWVVVVFGFVFALGCSQGWIVLCVVYFSPDNVRLGCLTVGLESMAFKRTTSGFFCWTCVPLGCVFACAICE